MYLGLSDEKSKKGKTSGRDGRSLYGSSGGAVDVIPISERGPQLVRAEL